MQLISDTHFEKFSGFDCFNSVKLSDNADFIAILGDIHVGVDCAFDFFKVIRRKSKADILFVAGNHDFEDKGYAESLLKMEELAKDIDGFYFLNDKAVTLKGFNFYGSTLWSDFELNGVVNSSASKIAVSSQDSFNRLKLSLDAIEILHRKGVDSLKEAVSKLDDLIVLTHFAPSRLSLADKYKNTVYSPYFASNLEKYTSYVKLWCHGHTHAFSDYELGCRVLSNPLHDSLSKNPFVIDL